MQGSRDAARSWFTKVLSRMSGGNSSSSSSSSAKRSKGDQEIDLLDRFKGAMLGGLLGDCLGSPLEFKSDFDLPDSEIGRHFKKMRKDTKEGSMKYTDDTAMAKQVAESLVHSACGPFDEWDLARRFALDFRREPYRGYGRGAVSVLSELVDLADREEAEEGKGGDPKRPAARQFNGSGSYGNGAAMRAHPVALHCHGRKREEMEEVAKAQALLTHSHKEGYQGAILQSYAVSVALQGTESNKEFVAKLKDLVGGFGEDRENSRVIKEGVQRLSPTFKEAVEMMEQRLKDKDRNKAIYLGNDVTALHSVPTAIYCALRARDIGDKDGIGVFERTLRLAFSFGGDTDTIGSMAGAVCGAMIGAGAIPRWMVDLCEDAEVVVDLAERLHQRQATKDK